MQFWSFDKPVPYRFAQKLMGELVDLRKRGLIPDTVLLLEHAPTVTRGRGLQWTGVAREKQMPAPDPRALPEGTLVVDTDRGGDLTYHGPGQLVIYPIVSLTTGALAPRRDLGAFIRLLETWIIDELAYWGIVGERRAKATGVWVGDRKVASIGISIKHWISSHGIAINVVNDLKPFFAFSPCGYSAEVMTRIADLAPRSLVNPLWREKMERRLALRISGERNPVVRRMPVDERVLEIDREEAAAIAAAEKAVASRQAVAARAMGLRTVMEEKLAAAKANPKRRVD